MLIIHVIWLSLIPLIRRKILGKLLDTVAQGALVRSRFQSIEMMDAPSKFFFNLEKKNGQRRFIHALRSESGSLLSDSHGIRKEQLVFMKNCIKVNSCMNKLIMSSLRIASVI